MFEGVVCHTYKKLYPKIKVNMNLTHVLLETFGGNLTWKQKFLAESLTDVGVFLQVSLPQWWPGREWARTSQPRRKSMVHCWSYPKSGWQMPEPTSVWPPVSAAGRLPPLWLMYKVRTQWTQHRRPVSCWTGARLWLFYCYFQWKVQVVPLTHGEYMYMHTTKLMPFEFFSINYQV